MNKKWKAIAARDLLLALSGSASSNVTVANSPIVDSGAACGSFGSARLLNVGSSTQSGNTFQIVATDPRTGVKSYSPVITVK